MKQRKTCFVCKRKRYAEKMKLAFTSSYVCRDKDYCNKHKDILIAKKIIVLFEQLKIAKKIHIFGK